MQVVILCGGQGTRIRDVADDIPKPMIPIGGRPILWHIMKGYAQQGFRDFVLCLGYKSWSIKRFFLDYHLSAADFSVDLADPSHFELHAPPAQEDWRVTLAETGLDAMTGCRVKRIEKYITGDTFMLTYGDGVADIDIRQLVEFHRSHGKIGTVTAVTAPGRFGEIELDGERVVEFQEKPLVARGRINGGFFVFQRRIFDRLQNDPRLVLENEPLAKLSASGQLAAFRHDGFWYPMDSSRDHKYLNELWSAGKAPWNTWEPSRPRNSLMLFHDFTPDDLHRIEVYTRDIEQKTIDTAAEAFRRLAPATLSLGAGQADFAVNRRNNRDPDVPKSLPHRGKLQGPVDHRVPVIAVRSSTGRLSAVVFAYSCHPVMTPESVWSGDFPGFAMLDLEQAHPEAVALFCQGCGGDQNCVRGPIALAREQGRLLATAVEQTLAKPMTEIEPRLATSAASITLDYERVVNRQELEAVLQAEDPRKSAKARWARQMLAEMNDRERLPTNYRYPMQAWKLGAKTLWVALSGEPLVDYALTLRAHYGPDTLVTGCCSDLMAYIPTRRIWEEARGEEVMYLWEYGRPAYRWAGDVEQRILAAAEQMARTLDATQRR